MRLLSPDHLAVLTDARTWRDNPFIARDARRDSRRKQPAKSLAWMGGTLLVFGLFAVWGLRWLDKQGYGIPWYLGGDLGVVLCSVFCGLQVWFVAGAAQKHTLAMLSQESARNTLSSLLMLPRPPFQTLLQSAMYPWLAAMRLALVGLPLYAFCVGLGGVTWWDILLLYVVFAMTAVCFPNWRIPVLGDGAPVFATTPQPAANTGAKTQATTAPTGSAGSSATGGWAAFGFILPLFALMFSIGSRRGFSGIYDALHPYLPDSIFVLLPSSLLSWPLLIARTLITPFDWFGFPLIPLPFVLIGFLLSRYIQLTRVSEFLSVGTYRDLAALPTYLPRRRLEGALRMGQALVMTGYLWKWAVRDGGLSFLAGRGPGNAPGLLGFVYALLFATGWRALIRAGTLGQWHRPEQGRVERLVARRTSPRSVLRFLAEPFCFAACFYLACCVLGRVMPFPASVLALAGKMLTVVLTGMMLSYGAWHAFGALTGLLALGLPALWLYGTVTNQGPQTKLLAFFSPTLGLLNLGQIAFPGMPALFSNQLPWIMWVADGGLTGLLLILLALLPSLRRSSAVDAAPFSLDPTLVGQEAFADVVVARAQSSARTESPLAMYLIASVQRVSDNAVLIKELRARLRGKLSQNSVKGIFLTYLVLTLFVVLGAPIVGEIFGSSLAHMLFGDIAAPGAQALANALCCWYVVLLFIASSAGFTLLPLAFAPEREKSTLGFLMMTPMRGGAIVRGKAAGLLIAGGLGVWSVALWTFALSLALAPTVGLLLVLRGWLMLMLTAAAIQITIGMIGMAIASLFPRMVSVAGSGVFGYIMMQLFIQTFTHTSMPRRRRRRRFRRAAPPLLPIPLNGMTVWLLFLLACLLLTLLCYALALWGVRRMRKGDIAFAASRREN